MKPLFLRIFVLTKTNIMKTNNTNNRTQKNWDKFAIISTIVALTLVIFSSVQIIINL